MTEKRQTSQDNIIRILQHFATKFRNITNFVMLFLDFCPDLSKSKFHSKGEITKLQTNIIIGFVSCLYK